MCYLQLPGICVAVHLIGKFLVAINSSRLTVCVRVVFCLGGGVTIQSCMCSCCVVLEDRQADTAELAGLGIGADSASPFAASSKGVQPQIPEPLSQQRQEMEDGVPLPQEVVDAQRVLNEFQRKHRGAPQNDSPA